MRADTVAVQSPVRLSWTRVEGASSYRYRIVPVDRLSDSISSVTSGTTATGIATLRPNTWYEWSVRAQSDSIVGRWSQGELFVTSPQAPVLRTPSQDAVDVATDRPRFEWLPVDSAIKYIVTVRRVSDGSVILVDSTSNTTLTPDTLPMATRCSWKVSAVGRYGAGPHSLPWGFTTSSSFVLDAPTTIAPKDIDQVDTLMTSLLWSSVSDATMYDVQITSRGSFANPDIELLGLSNPFCDVPELRPGTVYRWRAIGYSDTAVGRWSDTATFTTRSRFEQSLVPLSPTRNASDVPLRGVFRFSSSPVYVEYEAQVARDPFFGRVEHAFRSSRDTVEFYGLEPATLYYWRVVGFLPDAQIDVGETSTFTTTTSTNVHSEDSSRLDVQIAYVENGITVSTPITDNYLLSVYDLQGRRIHVLPTREGSHTMFLPFADLHNGCYVLVVQGLIKLSTRSFVFCR